MEPEAPFIGRWLEQKYTELCSICTVSIDIKFALRHDASSASDESHPSNYVICSPL